MTILSDRDILAAMQQTRALVADDILGMCAELRPPQVGIEPFDRRRLQPSSVDLTLGPLLRVPCFPPGQGTREIDLAEVEPGHTELREIGDAGYVLLPGKAVLCATEEVVTLGDSMAARVEGKSSLGRVFLAVHITAGFIDPGFEGHITLEVVNLSPWRLRLRVGMPVAQIGFFPTSSPVGESYARTGHYQGQRGPTESRYRMGS